MKRHVIVTFATGAALSLVACGKSPPEISNPPEPELVAPPTNPPPPKPEPGALPSWDEVKSTHPEGATNPPRPELIVTPAGDCYKNYVGGMIAPTHPSERVEECAEGCGTQVVCPPQAAKLLEDYKAGKTAQPK